MTRFATAARPEPDSAPRPRSALVPRLWAAALLAGCGVVLAAYVTWPLAPDHGIIGLVGRAWLRGGIPYRDAFDTKGPVAYAWFAAVEGAFGPSARAVRAVDAAMLGGGAILVALLLRRIAGRAVGWGTAALWVCFVPGLGYEHTAQPDGWVAVATAPAMLASWLAPGSPWSAALMGALGGGSALVKPLYLPLVAVAPFVAWLRGAPPRTILRQAALAAASAALVIAGTWGWFAANGAQGALVEAYLRYTTDVYWTEYHRGLFGNVFGVWVFWQWSYGRFVIPVAVAGAIALYRRDGRLATFVVAWTLAATALVAVQGRFFSYQWLPVLPPLCLLAVVGLVELATGLAPAFRVESRRFALPAYAALAAVSVAAISSVVQRNAQDVAAAAALALGRRDAATYERRFTRVPYVDESGDHRKAAAWLAATVPEGAGVGIWTFNPVGVWLSGRPVATRAFGWPLVLGPRTAERARLRREFMATLERDPPLAFVVDTVWETTWTEDASLDAFPELKHFLAARYDEADRVGALRLLALRAPPAR